jgi:hypothetical protein
MFIFFLITVTLALIATAAFFSVFGIAHMFAASFYSAMIFGLTLEAAKICVAIYLFRYWLLMSRLFKNILIVFLVALMFITSVGILGYLSQGYMKTAEQYRQLSIELSNLETELASKKVRLDSLNTQVNVAAESVVNKIRLSREFSDEQAEIRDRLAVIEPRIQDLKIKRLGYEAHIGPISYVASMLNADLSSMVFYAILMLVFVADPLAITLTIACNMVLMRYWENSRPRAEQVVRSPMMFNHFMSEIKAVANDSLAKYREKKEAKLAEKLTRKAAEEKKAELSHKAEETRLAKLAKEAEKLRKIEQAKQEQLAKEAEKARLAEEARQTKIAKQEASTKKAGEARLAAQAKKETAARQAEEAKRIAEAKKAEAARKAADARRAAAEKATARRAAKTRKTAASKKVAVSKPAPVKKAPAKKAPARKAPVKKSAPLKKAVPARRPAAPKKKKGRK